MVLVSFWTQDYVNLDTSFTLANYATDLDYAQSPIYLTLLGRSPPHVGGRHGGRDPSRLPIAYFLAFRVTRQSCSGSS